jgi:hypothetical protein
MRLRFAFGFNLKFGFNLAKRQVFVGENLKIGVAGGLLSTI